MRRHFAGGADFASRLAGRTIIAARRRGKYLWLPLDDGDAPARPSRHERPAARAPAAAPDETHLRVRFTFTDNEAAATRAALRRPADVRRPRRSPTAAPTCRRSSATSRATRSTRSSTTRPSSAALRRRRTGLKRALLDQTLVSGVGNIYADEALWRARLHYARPTETLTRAQVDAVLRRRPRP